MLVLERDRLESAFFPPSVFQTTGTRAIVPNIYPRKTPQRNELDRGITEGVPGCSITGSGGCKHRYQTRRWISTSSLLRNTGHTAGYVQRRFRNGRNAEILTNLESGRPYPKPAMGALKSLAWKS